MEFSIILQHNFRITLSPFASQMKSPIASLDLVEFIETQILPQYAEFDRAHNLEHVTRVIRRSLELAAHTGADVNMVYAIAAYHDLGMSGPRAVHHITGGRILAEDRRLRRWFNDEQVRIMREAVEDHRASNYPEKSREEHWQRFREHMDSKYSANGYIRLWIPGSQNEKRLAELRNIIANTALLRQQFDKYYNQEI